MGLFTGAMVYIVTWWICLFIVLPIGIQDEEGQKDAGHQGGAPKTPNLKKKALYTTILSLIVWLVFFCLVSLNIIDFREIAKTM